MRILSAAAFTIFSTENRLKAYSPEQLVFVRDIIIPIKHIVDWELLRQKKQTQNNRDHSRKNIKRIEYNYKVEDKVILNNSAVLIYETPFKGPFETPQCWTNNMVT